MSSPYPILDNKPIDKWKVTELKEELKRRKLTTRGLKEELVRRLDEALRLEKDQDAISDDDNKGTGQVAETDPIGTEATDEQTFSASETTLVAAKTARDTIESPSVAAETAPVAAETTPVASDTTTLASKTTPDAIDTSVVAIIEDDIAGNKDEKMGDVGNEAIVDSVAHLAQEKIEEAYAKGEAGAAKEEEKTVMQVTTVETSVTVTQTLVSPVAGSEQDHVDSASQKVTKDANIQADDEGSEPQQENEAQKPLSMDHKHDISAADNQVSQVPISGFEVKSDCISTDSLSNNENIEIKDNIIADNVKLEHNILKSEMLEPSSGNTGPVGGESHPMDVEEPLEKAAEDLEIKNASNVDVGDSEKLNLDRSSGDESIEEEEVDNKRNDSNTYDEVGNKGEKSETAKMEKHGDIIRDDSAVEKESFPDNKPISDKRKLIAVDKEEAANHEPAKRQRRLNRERTEVLETQVSKTTPVATPKGGNKSAVLNRNFSLSGSSAGDDGPKERVVPPSQKDPTNSLRIDRFLRPFTLKAVQELLGKTGTVNSFWMDQIKTHCYVTYASVEEAVETRNAVYNLQWPANGGRQLVAEFVDPDEVKSKLEAPPTPSTPAAPPSQPMPQQQQPLPRQQLHQKLPAPVSLPPPPPLLSNPAVRERLPPPPPLEKQDAPILTLDDLFKKTKSTPRIYYLPLSEEQVAAKLAARNARAV